MQLVRGAGVGRPQDKSIHTAWHKVIDRVALD